jgi:cyclohexyl-isocyanide hydratase
VPSRRASRKNGVHAADTVYPRFTALDLIGPHTLAILEATPVVERYVEHGNRMTGAGISAGIDFGLRLAERLRGAGEAQRIQLNLEYAPEPPYPGGGSPETAPPSIVSALESRYVPFLAAANAAAEDAAANFP